MTRFGASASCATAIRHASASSTAPEVVKGAKARPQKFTKQLATPIRPVHWGRPTDLTSAAGEDVNSSFHSFVYADIRAETKAGGDEARSSGMTAASGALAAARAQSTPTIPSSSSYNMAPAGASRKQYRWMPLGGRSVVRALK